MKPTRRRKFELGWEKRFRERQEEIQRDQNDPVAIIRRQRELEDRLRSLAEFLKEERVIHNAFKQLEESFRRLSQAALEVRLPIEVEALNQSPEIDYERDVIEGWTIEEARQYLDQRRQVD